MINRMNISKAYSEVYSFLEAIGEEYMDKVPRKIYNHIKENRDMKYTPIYKKEQRIAESEISKEALALIAGLNLQYWCEDEKEREKLKECYATNAKKEDRSYYENLFPEKPEKKEEKRLVQYNKKKNVFLQWIQTIKEWWERRKI